MDCIILKYGGIWTLHDEFKDSDRILDSKIIEVFQDVFSSLLAEKKKGEALQVRSINPSRLFGIPTDRQAAVVKAKGLPKV